MTVIRESSCLLHFVCHATRERAHSAHVTMHARSGTLIVVFEKQIWLLITDENKCINNKMSLTVYLFIYSPLKQCLFDSDTSTKSVWTIRLKWAITSSAYHCCRIESLKNLWMGHAVALNIRVLVHEPLWTSEVLVFLRRNNVVLHVNAFSPTLDFFSKCLKNGFFYIWGL